MKYAGGERRVGPALLERRQKMFRRSRASGSHQGNAALCAHGAQLFDVVAGTHPVGCHAVEHDLAGAAILRLLHPGQGGAPGIAGACRIARVLVDAQAGRRRLAVDAGHDALGAEAPGQLIDQSGALHGRRVHRDLLRSGGQYFLGIRHRAHATGYTEGNIEDFGNAADPGAIDRAAFGTGGDVVEHELIGTGVTVAARQLDDLTDHAMVTKAPALDHLAVADIETGNYATRKNGCSPSGDRRSSSRAVPLTAAVAPAAASACRSAMLETPPEACQ